MALSAYVGSNRCAMIKPKLSDRLAQTIIGQAANEMAKYTNFQQEGANLVALCVASWSVGVGYVTAYEDGNTLPMELYFMAEGRSGEGKSRAMNLISKGFTTALDIESEKRKKMRAELLHQHAENTEGKAHVSLSEQTLLEQDLIKNHPLSHNVSDATVAAMDDMLKEQQGWFVLKSSEQGLIDGLLFGNNGENNIDFMLNGFDGESSETRRLSRVGFSGRPHGGIGVFSQEGTIEKIIQASGNRGLTQRFLMLSEPSVMGSRVFGSKKEIPKELGLFNSKCQEIVTESLSNNAVLNIENLRVIQLDDDSWSHIFDFKNEIEPMLGSGGRYEPAILSSMWSKIEMFIMKVASTLHIFSGKSHMEKVCLDTTLDASLIVQTLFIGVTEIASAKGVVGLDIEERAILEYLEEKGRIRGVDIVKIKNTMSRRKVFEEYQGGKSKRVADVLQGLANSGKVRMDNINGTEFYKFVKF